MTGKKISKRDLSWLSAGVTLVAGPLQLPPVDRLRGAAAAVGAALPQAMLGHRIDARTGSWEPVDVDPAELVLVDPEPQPGAGPGALAQRAAALRPQDAPVRWVVSGDHLVLSASHVIGDADLLHRLLTGLVAAAGGARLDDAGRVARHPLTRALWHHYGRHPRRAVATAAALRAARRAAAPPPALAGPARPATVVHAGASAGAAAEVRAWQGSAAPGASTVAVQTWLVDRALTAVGLPPHAALLTLFDARAHLPKDTTAPGNFSAGLWLPVAEPRTPQGVDDAVRVAYAGARSLTALTAAAAGSPVWARRSDTAAPPEGPPSVPGRPVMTMTVVGGRPDVESLPWVAPPGERLLLAFTTPGPGGVTCAVSQVSGRRQYSLSFREGDFEVDRLQRAVDLAAHSPGRLLSAGCSSGAPPRCTSESR